MNVSDEWRSIGSLKKNWVQYCDATGRASGLRISNISSIASKMVYGNNWFRFIPPAGNRLSNIALGLYACNTALSGWMNGSNPRVVGQILERKVCFDGLNPCFKTQNIKVGRCQYHNNDFIVYQLRQPPSCNSAYCVK